MLALLSKRHIGCTGVHSYTVSVSIVEIRLHLYGVSLIKREKKKREVDTAFLGIGGVVIGNTPLSAAEAGR